MTGIGDKVLIFPLEGDKENLVAIDPSTSETLDLHGITEDHKFRGLYRSEQTAGEDLVFGEIVNFRSDSKWYKTDANTMTKCRGELGFVLEDLLTDEIGKIGKIIDVRDDSWSWTTNAMLFLSCTPGEMTETKPSGSANQIRKAAVALSATLVAFAPDCTIIEMA